MLKTSTINKHDIKNNSPTKSFIAESKSLIELKNTNKKPIPKFLAATTSAKPLPKSNVLMKQMERWSPLRKQKGLKELHPIASDENQWL